MDYVETGTAALAAAVRTDDVDERLALLPLALARERVDAAIAATVAEARGVHRSWARIGKALGVTRQAAQSRLAHLMKPSVEPEQVEPASPARTPRPRTEMVALATARGFPLLRLHVERVPIAVARRSTSR